MRLVVATMVGAFVPAAIAAYACETTCAALSEATVEAPAEHSRTGTPHSEHEVPSSDHAGHLEHGGVCHLVSIVCAPPANSPPVLGAYVDTWLQPVETAFVSFISPPPIHPPRT